MTARDISTGERLCCLSRWNQLNTDWQLFLERNSNGCRVAEIDGEVVGTVVVLPYEDRFTWISMVLVDPTKRRNGIGTRLLQEGLAVAGEHCCVRLDATEAGRHIYSRYGFEDEYPISRMTCPRVNTATLAPCPEARRILPDDVPRIVEFDREIFGADRTPILRSLLSRAPDYAWLIEDSQIKGYCFGRDGFLYQQIGPIVAENDRLARMLISCCLSPGRARSHVIDALDHGTEWRQWLKLIGFVEERSFTRMFRGEKKFPGDPKRIFAAAGPELG